MTAAFRFSDGKGIAERLNDIKPLFESIGFRKNIVFRDGGFRADTSL
jgi:hypothetical protein